MRNRPCVIAAVLMVLGVAGCASSPPSAEKAAGLAPAPADKDAKAVEALVRQGDVAWQAQDLDRAVYLYVQALDKSPHDAVTMAKIGAIEDRRGNAPLALKAFEMAHEANPAEPHIAERLARLYLKSGNVNGAAALYTGVLSADARRSRALDGMGEVCLARDDFAQAVVYFDRALQADQPDRAAVLTHRGLARMHLNDLGAAESDLRLALSVPPREDAWTLSPTESWRYLGDVLVLRGDAAGGLESLLHAMSTAEAFNEIGVTLMSVKRYQDAREYFTKAIAASASWFEEAQRNLALVDERLRNSAG